MAGSVSRPWEKFMHDVEVVARVDFVGGKNAIFAVDFKDGDRDHQVARKLESVGLGKGKIVSHLRGSIREQANSCSMAPQGPGDGRGYRERQSLAAAA